MQRISIFIFIALLLWLSIPGGARTYIVDDSDFANYNTIQGAVDAANDGDTIYIKPGQYSEEIVLNKSLTIMPLSGETDPIILDGRNSLETAVSINSDGCSLQGLTAKNYVGPAIQAESEGNLIQENIIENSNPAILVRGSSKNMIAGNSISNSDIQGGIVLLENSGNNSIEKNRIVGCNSSILIHDASGNQVLANEISGARWGIWLDNTDGCRILENKIEAEYFGILLQDNSSKIELQRNEINGGSIGIGVSKTEEISLQDNLIAGSSYALKIENLSHSSILQNRLDRSNIGIELVGSSQNNFTENQLDAITDTAIQVAYSDDNSFTGNAISDSQNGIILVDAPSNFLSRNSFENVSWCLYVEASSQEGFNNSIDESNLADSHPLLYLFNRSGEEIKGMDMAHVTLAYCNNLTVQNSSVANDALFLYNSRDNRIIGNSIISCYGMRLEASDGNEISGNRVAANQFSGMFLYDSDSNSISENYVTRNSQNGISLLSCSKNTIRDNVLDGNVASGIWLNLSDENRIYQNNISNSSIGLEVLESLGNSIFHNNFWDNSEHSQDSQGTNSWDQGNVTGGNYWDDHVAKGNPSQSWPRMIKGGNNLDRYPFQDRDGWRLPGAALSPE
jgi:parallel beta-helix repeat protein